MSPTLAMEIGIPGELAMLLPLQDALFSNPAQA